MAKDLSFCREFDAARLNFCRGTNEWPIKFAKNLWISAQGAVGKVGLWRGGDLGQDGVMKKVDLQGDWAQKVGFVGNVGAETGLLRVSEGWLI